MDVINSLFTLIQETPFPKKILYIVSISASVIYAIVLIARAMHSIYTWITKK